MEKKKYLKNDGENFTFISSRAVGNKLKKIPIPVVCQSLSGQKVTSCYAWLFITPRKRYLLPMFKNEHIRGREEQISFTPLRQGDVFFKDEKLYKVCFDETEKYCIKNVFILCHEDYARIEAQAMNVVCIKFELCALYDVVAPKDTRGFCWLGHSADGSKIFVKVFQDDCEDLKKINPMRLIFKPIAVGETFFAQNMWWCLLQDRNNRLYIDEAVVRSCEQKRQNKAEEQLAEDEKNVRLR